MTRPAAEFTLRRWLMTSAYSQSDLADLVGVSRAAVSNWCLGRASPSPSHAAAIEKLSEGAVPASIWPRREFAEGNTAGARAIWRIARERGVSIMRLAQECGIPQRSFARWAAGQYRPRAAAVRKLNKKLDLSLSVTDFEVRA